MEVHECFCTSQINVISDINVKYFYILINNQENWFDATDVMVHKRKSIKSFSQIESSPPEVHGIYKTILEENNKEAKQAKRM